MADSDNEMAVNAKQSSFAGGDIFSTGLGMIGSFFQDKEAARQAKKARKWSEYMSNTAHQREVADLRAAGLNPILSATGGGGASTPASPVAPVSDKAEVFLKSSALALQRHLNRAQLDNINASTRKLESEKTGQDIGNDLAMQNIEFGKTDFKARTQTAIETIQNLRQVRESSAIDIKSKQRDYDRLANELVWIAKNAPADYDRRELQKLIDDYDKNGKGDMSYFRRILPYVDSVLKSIGKSK